MRIEGSVYRLPAPPKPSSTTSYRNTRDIAPSRTTVLPTYVAPVNTQPIIDPLLGSLGLVLNDPSNPTIPLPGYNPPSSGGGTGGGTGGGGGGTSGGTGGGGGGTGGGGSIGDISTGLDPSLYSALLPFLSPEDRERLLSTLSIQGVKLPEQNRGSGAFSPDASREGAWGRGTRSAVSDTGVDRISVIPGELRESTREQYLGAPRAQSLSKALENFAKAQGKTSDELGPGYRFLTEIADNLQRYTNRDSAMSRKQYTEFLGQMNPLLQQGGEFAELGRMLALPFFSQGNLFNVSQDRSGQYLFGDANKRLFR